MTFFILKLLRENVRRVIGLYTDHELIKGFNNAQKSRNQKYMIWYLI